MTATLCQGGLFARMWHGLLVGMSLRRGLFSSVLPVPLTRGPPDTLEPKEASKSHEVCTRPLASPTHVWENNGVSVASVLCGVWLSAVLCCGVLVLWCVVVVCCGGCGGGCGTDVMYDTCLCRYAPTHATNSGGGTPGSKLPASPPPLPRPDGGGNTLAVYLCTRP